MGVYSAEDAQRIIRSCEAVEVSLARGEAPWDLRWSEWRPPSEPSGGAGR